LSLFSSTYLAVGVEQLGDQALIVSQWCLIVRDENLDVNTQYKKTYKGPDLIRPNEQKTHTMATRSTKAPRVVIRRTKEISPNQ
jgi:hypothetical protein